METRKKSHQRCHILCWSIIWLFYLNVGKEWLTNFRNWLLLFLDNRGFNNGLVLSSQVPNNIPWIFALIVAQLVVLELHIQNVNPCSFRKLPCSNDILYDWIVHMDLNIDVMCVLKQILYVSNTKRWLRYLWFSFSLYFLFLLRVFCVAPNFDIYTMQIMREKLGLSLKA